MAAPPRSASAAPRSCVPRGNPRTMRESREGRCAPWRRSPARGRAPSRAGRRARRIAKSCRGSSELEVEERLERLRRERGDRPEEERHEQMTKDATAIAPQPRKKADERDGEHHDDDAIVREGPR